MSKKTRKTTVNRKTASQSIAPPKLHAFGDATLMESIYGQIQLAPAPGYVYQSFFDDQIHSSVLRPDEAEYIQNQAMKGLKLLYMHTLHFSDEHAEVFQQIVAKDAVDAKCMPLHTYVLIALEHMLNENFSISEGLALSQIQNGHSKNEIQLLYPRLQHTVSATEEDIAEFDEIVTSVWNRYEHDRLNKFLPKSGNRSGLVKI